MRLRTSRADRVYVGRHVPTGTPSEYVWAMFNCLFSYLRQRSSRKAQTFRKQLSSGYSTQLREILPYSPYGFFVPVQLIAEPAFPEIVRPATHG
jgi:hypothetical protein